MFPLALICGALVGFALGLTGAGGGIFAVPLLVYGMALAPREAVGVSLSAVGGTALLGVVPRLKRGEVAVRQGLVFAATGIVGAPIGQWISAWLPDRALLRIFAGFMLIVAWHMWRRSRPTATDSQQHDQTGHARNAHHGGIRWALLIGVALVTGMLSGALGVGGGLIIVPALMLLSHLEIHQAVATSLMVIALVSLSAVGTYLMAGGTLPWLLTINFLAAGCVGMFLGSKLAHRLPGPALQRAFSVMVLMVAVAIVVKSMG